LFTSCTSLKRSTAPSPSSQWGTSSGSGGSRTCGCRSRVPNLVASWNVELPVGTHAPYAHAPFAGCGHSPFRFSLAGSLMAMR